MSSKRGSNLDDTLDRTTDMAGYETARSAANPPAAADPHPKKEEEHISLFWRVFGGTILSIVALVAITLYNNLSSSITELRAEVSREREARAELVKKEEFNTRISSQYERIRSYETVKVDLERLKERAEANGVAVEGLKRDGSAIAESLKKDVAALEVLRERLVAIEAARKDAATAVDGLKKETSADLKGVRDDLQKLNAEVSGNKTADHERKMLRDAQHKAVEESIKELQKGVQDCREKLARLEGAQPKPQTELPIPYARPVDPSRTKPVADPDAPVKPGAGKPGGGDAEPGSGKGDGR